MNKTAIEVRGVYKSFKLPHEKQGTIKSMFINIFRKHRTYEKQLVLENITFDIKEGDFFGIVGRNGSGKSTLLKLIAGIYNPDRGGITLNGTLTPFIELGVGFNPELTGRENVFLNGALLGFSRKEMVQMYDEIVEFAELERFMDQKLKNYSSGMQVRLAFSIAIQAKSDILMLDEVLAVGDSAFQQKCFNYFEELKHDKKTVVFVSHDMGALRRFCTKAVYIKSGMLTAEGSAEEIADIYMVENIEDSPVLESNENEINLSSNHSIGIKVSFKSAHNVVLNIEYKSKDKEKMYVGISVIKDGVSIAEIITSPDKYLAGNGKVIYSLDTNMLNSGIYNVSAALFKMKNRELIAAGDKKAQFIIKGHDITKGAALKLPDAWGYE